MPFAIFLYFSYDLVNLIRTYFMPLKCSLSLSNYPISFYYFALNEKEKCPFDFLLKIYINNTTPMANRREKSHRQDNALPLHVPACTHQPIPGSGTGEILN